MKTKPKSILSLLCLLALTSFFTGCGETVTSDPLDAESEISDAVITEGQVQRRDGLVYRVGQAQPFTGVVSTTYENGEKWEARYKNGKKDGTHTYWLENGQKHWRYTYKDGERDGKSMDWDSQTGMLYSEDLYKEGKLIEELGYEWFDNGQMREKRSWRNHQKDGDWIWWYESGQQREIIPYKSGELRGTWTVWHENGALKRVMDCNGSPGDGFRTWWWENGQKRGEVMYKDGLEEGRCRAWFPNGQQRSEIYYKAGKYEGAFTLWHDNGQRKEEGFFKDDKPDGKWSFWYENGKKSRDEIYKDGFIEQVIYSPE